MGVFGGGEQNMYPYPTLLLSLLLPLPPFPKKAISPPPPPLCQGAG